MQKKFLITVDAQKLAKWLRLLGYDTKVIKAVSLLNLIRIAQKEKRIIVSRSKDVLNHPLPFDRIYIHSNTLEEQLQEIKEFLKFSPAEIFTRCPEDNEVLKEVSKSEIIKLIPEKVAEQYDDFRICHRCGRVYWKGSHYEKILEELENIFEIK